MLGTRRLIPLLSAAVEDLSPTAVIKCIIRVWPVGRMHFYMYGSNMVLSVGLLGEPLPPAVKHALSSYLLLPNGNTHVF